MANQQNPPRDHHYVPQLLLRRFTDAENRLWIYDLEKGKIHRGNTRSAAFTRNLYTVTTKDGTTDSGLIEKKIADHIDSPGDRAIRRLLRREQLGDDWNDFLGFVAAQLLRTPAYFDHVRALMKPTMQEMLERMAKFEPAFRDAVRKSALNSGMTEEEIEVELQATCRGDYKIQPSREIVLVQSMKLIAAIHAELSRMKWQIAELEDSEPDLILGDHPALPVVPPGEHAGLRNPNIDLMLPLSKRVAAVANWDGEVTYGTFALGMADNINRETMRHAKRFLFSSSCNHELLKKAQALHGTGPKLTTTKIRVGERLMFLNEYR